MDCRRYNGAAVSSSSDLYRLLEAAAAAGNKRGLFNSTTSGYFDEGGEVDASLQPNPPPAADFETDLFCWFVEGILILVVGCLGLLGNSLSLVVFSRQKVHRIFHNLLLTLTIFDTLYVFCSILVFSVPKFFSDFEQEYAPHTMLVLLPLAHVGLMGSVYCTLAMTVERFLAVYYPFLPHRRVYTSRTFIWPIILFTLAYNVPKFFELRRVRLCVPSDEEVLLMAQAPAAHNWTVVAAAAAAAGMQHHNYPDYEYYSDQHDPSAAYDGDDDLQSSPHHHPRLGELEPVPCSNTSGDFVREDIIPTKMRTNRAYIRVYILWMNLIFQILLPFVVLLVLNLKIYDKIKEFERKLEDNVRVIYSTNAARTSASNSNRTPSCNIVLGDGGDGGGGGRNVGGNRSSSVRRSYHRHQYHHYHRRSPSAATSTSFRSMLTPLRNNSSPSSSVGSSLSLRSKNTASSFRSSFASRRSQSAPRQQQQKLSRSLTNLNEANDEGNLLLLDASAAVATEGHGGSDATSPPAISPSPCNGLHPRGGSVGGSAGMGKVTSLRRREVKLARISLYIVIIFLICHGIRLLPNGYEVLQTHREDYNPDEIPWPDWVFRLTNLSHFLLTLACSANFYIYYAKHGQVCKRRRSGNGRDNSPGHNRSRGEQGGCTTNAGGGGGGGSCSHRSNKMQETLEQVV